MSTIEDLSPTTTPAEQPPAAGADRRPNGRRPRRAAVVASAAIVALVGGSVAVAVLSSKGGHVSLPVTAPVTLPSTLVGLTAVPAANDQLKAQAWTTKATKALGTVGYAAGTYTASGSRRTVRVVLARTDLTGKLDQTWAADAGHEVGDDRCTQNVRVAAGTTAAIRPTVMVCWRSTPAFSGYAIVIDPLAKTPVPDTDGAAALDEAWKAAGGPA